MSESIIKSPDKQFTTIVSRKKAVLEQILYLQEENLADRLSPQELGKEGFVTVQHDVALLKKIAGTYGHTLALSEGKVIGYALSMLPDFGDAVPVLVSMFDLINLLSFRGRPLFNTRYLVVGQVCVAKPYRGQGVFPALYQEMKREFSSEFTYLITEIAERNTRSLRAHEKLGFQCIHTYSTEQEDWQIVLWDWS